MHKIFLIVILVFIASTTFAQRRKKSEDTVAIDLKKIDSLIQPVPKNRQLFHLYIDDNLVKVDYLDGKYDNQVTNYRGETIDVIINNAVLRRAKHLANYVENETFSVDPMVNNNTKIRYLQAIRTNLETFNSDAYDGKVIWYNYKDMFDELENLMVASKNNELEMYVRNHSTMGVYLNKYLFEDNKELTSKLLDSMCIKYPDVMETQLSSIAKTDGACYIMANMARKSVTRVLTSAMSTNYERDIVRKCNDPLVKSINEIATKTANPLRAIVFLEDYRNNTMTVEQINELTATDQGYYKALVKMKIENKENNKYIVNRDLKVEALNYVREINALHDAKDDVRFKILTDLKPQELYYLGVMCSEEIYTSSFIKGVYKNLVTKMQPSTGDQFLESIKMDKFRVFIRMCANYNLLDSFLFTMQPNRKLEIMKDFVVGLGDKAEIDMEGSVNVADAFGSINDPQLITFLKEEVRKEYEKNYNNNNKDGVIDYFILYTLFTSKDDNSDDSTFNGTLTNKLKMPPINKMPFDRLVSQDGKIYEQVYFYGDEDGKQSYANFKAFINSFKAFKIDESNEWFTKITSINSKIPMEIYANKPLDEEKELDEKAQIQLNEYLTTNNIEPTILVHRGHSYHLPNTIDNIGDNNKVIILGSCGGYHNLSKVLLRSPESQMVSSKQVGSMHVNDPIIEEVNKAVMNGTDVNWVTIWETLDKKMVTAQQKDLFNDYIPPHKNLGALFLKAFKTLKEQQL